MTGKSHVVSVNVGVPRTIMVGDRRVRTGIFKSPVTGPVEVGAMNLAGDAQADRRVHGGMNKAVYLYPAEHYATWRTELAGLAATGEPAGEAAGEPVVELPWGIFGENLTILGLLEDEVHVGDRLRIGTAELIVTQPREPCYKLGIRFGDPSMLQRFHAARRSGFYASVAEQGVLQAGDPIEHVVVDPAAPTIAAIVARW
jgi:MOSC domain-containing protein YiiM